MVRCFSFSLSDFTLFTYKAPSGMRAMGALANAAIATFLVEAFNKYVGGEVFGIKFLEQLGDAREVLVVSLLLG